MHFHRLTFAQSLTKNRTAVLLGCGALGFLVAASLLFHAPERSAQWVKAAGTGLTYVKEDKGTTITMTLRDGWVTMSEKSEKGQRDIALAGDKAIWPTSLLQKMEEMNDRASGPSGSKARESLQDIGDQTYTALINR